MVSARRVKRAGMKKEHVARLQLSPDCLLDQGLIFRQLGTQKEVVIKPLAIEIQAVRPGNQCRQPFLIVSDVRASHTLTSSGRSKDQ